MPALAAMYPQEETDDTRAGTASHWYSTDYLKGIVHTLGSIAPNGVVLTAEMMEGGNMLIEDVWNRLAELGVDPRTAVLFVEQRVSMKYIHPEHNWGTPDVFIWIPHLNLVIVWDYKFGHKEVDVYENDQCIDYVAGICEHVGIPHHQPRVEIRIVQPRCYTSDGPVRVWHTSGAELEPHWQALRYAAHASTTPGPQVTSGAHCLYCPARHSCGAARKSAVVAMEYSQRSMPEPVTPDMVGFEMELLERAELAIKARKTGLQELAKSIIRHGRVIQGYTLEPTNGRLDWVKPPDEIRNLGRAYQVEVEKKDQFITPTQLKALLKKKGIDEAVINTYAARATSGLALVKQDSKIIQRILRNGK